MDLEKLCDRCEEAEGTVMCFFCSALLCKKCDQIVHSNPRFSSHRRIHEYGVAGVCAEHEMRAVAFCGTCKELCCMCCMTAPEHSGHLFLGCTSVSVRYAEKHSALLTALENAKELTQSISTDVQNEISALNEQRQKTLDAIDAAFSHVTDLLEERRATLIESVTAAADAEEHSLQLMLNELDAKCVWAEQTLDDLRKKGQEGEGEGATSFVAMSAEADKCFTEICAEIHKKLQVPKFDLSSIAFNETVSLAKGRSIESLVESFGHIGDPASRAAQNGAGLSESDVKASLAEPETKAETTSHISHSRHQKALSIMKKEDGSFDRTPEVVNLTWADAPEMVVSLAARHSYFVFVLEARCKSPEFREVYCGRELTAHYEGIVPDAPTVFRVRGCFTVPGEAIKKELWVSNELVVNWSDLPGKWAESLLEEYVLAENNTQVSFSGSGQVIAMGKAKIIGGGVYKWKYKIKNPINAGGGELCLGIAPEGFIATVDPDTCGGYFFGCYFGRPRSSDSNDPGNKTWPIRQSGSYVNSGEEIGIIVDMVKGQISFILKGKEYDNVFEKVPVGVTFVPAVISCSNKNSVRLLPL